MITATMVKDLREQTQAGMMDCKAALDESGGDMTKAAELLRKKGLADAAKRAGRTAKEGLVHAYIHANHKLGVLIEVNCETDFVARTEDFKALVHNLAMQVAAANPAYVRREDVPEAVLIKEKEIYREQLKDSGKPEKVLEKIIAGKLDKYFQDNVLLEQQYIREEDRRVNDLVVAAAAKLGENVVVKRFQRFAIGE